MINSENKAWDILRGLDPVDVCNRSLVTYNDVSGTFTLKSFACTMSITTKDAAITVNCPECSLIPDDQVSHVKQFALFYLINAQNIPLSGNLIKPDRLTGGQIYVKGSHVLPLNEFAEKYGEDPDSFLVRGKDIGGEKLNYGDASMRFFPLPRIPVTVILWKKDDEFSAHSNLLLDSTCENHLPADIIWSTVSICVRLLLGKLPQKEIFHEYNYDTKNSGNCDSAHST